MAKKTLKIHNNRTDQMLPVTELDGFTWQQLQAALTHESITEEVLQAMLDREVNNRKRLQFLLRIHGRYNKLRTTRERNELMTTAAA